MDQETLKTPAPCADPDCPCPAMMRNNRPCHPAPPTPAPGEAEELTEQQLVEFQALREDVRRKQQATTSHTERVVCGYYRLDCILDEADQLQKELHTTRTQLQAARTEVAGLRAAAGPADALQAIGAALNADLLQLPPAELVAVLRQTEQRLVAAEAEAAGLREQQRQLAREAFTRGFALSAQGYNAEVLTTYEDMPGWAACRNAEAEDMLRHPEQWRPESNL